MLQNFKNKIGLVIGSTFMTFSAWAQQGGVKDLGGLANQGGDTAGSTLGGILGVVALIGFLFFLFNGSKLLKARNNQQETDADNWKGLLLGVFLLSPLTVYAIFFNSALDEDRSGSDIRTQITKGSKATQ